MLLSHYRTTLQTSKQQQESADTRSQALRLHISVGCSDNPKQIRTTLHHFFGMRQKVKTLKIEIPQKQIRQLKLQTKENHDFVQALWKNDDT